MEQILVGIIMVVMIAVGSVISYGLGLYFRIKVLKHDIEKGNIYLQYILTYSIGVLLFVFLMFMVKKMECGSGDNEYSNF